MSPPHFRSGWDRQYIPPKKCKEELVKLHRVSQLGRSSGVAHHRHPRGGELSGGGAVRGSTGR